MNKISIIIFLLFGITRALSQNNWTEKAKFGGSARSHAVGFSIGNYGYVGTGSSTSGYNKDFWQYDPEFNTWTQKADFGGTARMLSTGFSIGSKGYVGTGQDNSGFRNDFWEYDPITNTWAQKANFEGSARWRTVGFSIGSKGYMGTGYDGSFKKDFWEYDPSADVWTQKANFGGTGRESAVGFAIGSKGYIGTGGSNFGTVFYNDFWEFDPSDNNWTQKATFGGLARTAAVGFTIGDKGYIGTGADTNSEKKDFWEYDPLSNSWIEGANFGGDARHGATGFTIDSKGFLGTGFTTNGLKNDFWEFTPVVSEPACSVPATFSTVNISATTAKFKWLGISDALSYKMRYKANGTSEWIIVKSIENHKTLNALTPATEYTWQVKSFCDIQPVVASEWSEKQFFTTKNLKLSNQAADETTFNFYPNPLASSATISFYLPENSEVTIELLDVNGRTVNVIVEKNFPSGNQEIAFDKGSLTAGIYFLNIKTSEGVWMKQLSVIK
ncbi:MAG: T9SS type A sorting domain-containing protein [Chitinophagales bacterium]|nr:T9SS type A sorting domain-containing protein [Chitinophagales bacterium]